VLRIGADGRWAEVSDGVGAAPADATVVAGPLLPGMVDAHSHAFQRAFAGAAERRDSGRDDFWSWRERMYAVALGIGPQALRAIAAQLYVELLRGGYTHVCEFHYLRRDTDGSDYDDPLAMSWALADAAADTGIGLTILPVLYERASFDAPLRDEQRRFRADAQATFDAVVRIRAAGRARVGAGLAVHSLRAASAEAIAAIAEGVAGPIHIHVAEQIGEVDACLRATGRRPIEWLVREGVLGPRWQLVHATHASADEVAAVAASGAGVVVCPSTEANLGDGVFDLPAWLAAGVPLALGSDSQATRDWREEIRLLEYAQRLVRRARNVAAAPELGIASTAERLFACALGACARAAGEPGVGPRRRRARRCAGHRPPLRLAPRHRAGAVARRARLQQPVAAVARRDGRREVGRSRRPPRRGRPGSRWLREDARRARPALAEARLLTVFRSPGSEPRYAAIALISGCVNGRAMPIMIALLRPMSGL
jgi:formimidoylglutamate deiminase